MENIDLSPVESNPDPKKVEYSSSSDDKKLLNARNAMCVVAALLFLVAVLSQYAANEIHIILRSIAYLFGAVAYWFELLVLTDRFTVNPGVRIMFMPAVFGVLYIVLCVSYLMHWAH